MIVFKDGNKIITRVNQSKAIKFHNRILINPSMFIEEGNDVMIFTDKNAKEFQKHFKINQKKLF